MFGPLKMFLKCENAEKNMCSMLCCLFDQIFLYILTVGLVYEWLKGGLDWY